MGFRVKGLGFKTVKNTCGICQEGHPEFKVLHCSSKVWFESECVVVDIHLISTSQPVKRGKMM